MAYVLKITYGDTLHRMIVKPNSSMGAFKLTYAQLELKIRYLFKISSYVELVLTYKDGEGDTVTISEDEDLEVALVIQGLNPLRINVKHGESKQGQKKGEIKEAKIGDARKDSEAGFSFAAEYPSLASMIEETFFPAMDSLNSIASVELKNFSERLERDAEIRAKVISEVFQAFNKASKKPFKEQPKSGGHASSHNEVAGTSETAFPDVAAEFSHFAPNLAQNLFAGHPSYQADSVFHNGVQCDQCGVIPIVGPRYKSTNCFGESQASGADYIRHDQPLRQFPARGLGFHNLNKMPRSSFQSHVPGRCGFGNRGGFHGRHDHRAFNHNIFGKLDCRFVRDVTIFDGTELAPGTPFTKIWRLRNSGNIPWPQTTEILHVGGDELTSEPVASLELPVGGLPPDSEIEASVDLVAPQNLGRYITHWRLMVPSGVKFGHRIWVSVQVVSKDKQSPQVLESLKYNAENNHQHTTGEALREDGEGVVKEHIPEKQFEGSTVNSSHSTSCFEVNVEGPSAPLGDLVEEILQNEVENGFEQYPSVEEFALEREVQKNVEDVEMYLPESCVNEDVKMENAEPATVSLPESYVNESFNVEDSEVGTSSLVDVRSPVAVDASLTSKNSSKSASETSTPQVEVHPSPKESEALLNVARASLIAMGYTDRSLNLELLEKHDHKLPHMLYELFSAEKWDPMLGELQEMGFTDVDLNRHLLFKNKGSLKRVVKELVQMYKESLLGRSEMHN